MGDAEASKPVPPAAPPVSPAQELRGWLLGFAGWVVPGLGHFLQKKYDRAVVFFLCVTAMGALGLAMGARLYAPPFDRTQGAFVLVLHVLGFVGDLGLGALFLAAWAAGLGQFYMDRALGDYGTVFFLSAGLLCVLTALDAYDIAVGKKA
ncbi:MAG: DUF6677 family protein [Candidatus Acidiferrales bacterium]